MNWQLLLLNKWFLVFTILWTLPWKGYALWKAARRGEKYWFMVMLVVNSYALIEILYIFVFAKDTFREKFARFFNK